MVWRRKLEPTVVGVQVLITTPEVCLGDFSKLSSFSWEVLIVDEVGLCDIRSLLVFRVWIYLTLP